MNEMLNNPFGLTETEIYVFGLGREHEQERIIKLLEAKDENLIGEISDWFEYGLEHQAGRAARSRVIALIKGEESNNEEFSGTSISNHVAKQRRTIRRYP